MKHFWFIDTRKEDSKPFAIHNKDVAKSWKNANATDDGPFKPIETPEGFGEQTQVEPDETSENNENGPMNDGSIDPGVYGNMTKEELKGELEAREIQFKSKATNDELIALLVEDDKTGGE